LSALARAAGLTLCSVTWPVSVDSVPSAAQKFGRVVDRAFVERGLGVHQALDDVCRHLLAGLLGEQQQALGQVDRLVERLRRARRGAAMPERPGGPDEAAPQTTAGPRRIDWHRFPPAPRAFPARRAVGAPPMM